jgi:hypothetical protein
MDATSSAPLDAISAAWRTILLGLRAALGSFGLEAALAVAMHRRVGLIALQIERMLARFRAGRLRQVTGRETLSDSGAIRRRRIDTLPRRFGWLVRAGGHRAAGFGKLQ